MQVMNKPKKNPAAARDRWLLRAAYALCGVRVVAVTHTGAAAHVRGRGAVCALGDDGAAAPPPHTGAVVRAR